MGMRASAQPGMGERDRFLAGRLGVSPVSLSALGISVVLHLVFWFGFRVRPTAILPAAYEPPGIVYQPSPDEVGSVAALRLRNRTLLDDPTLLSLPHPRGFSRETMDRWTASLRHPPEWGWRDAALSAPSARVEARSILPTIPPSALAAARIRPSAARPEPVEIGASGPAWPREVIWRFLAPHGGLDVVDGPSFPDVPGAAPERPATVRAGFDAAGRVRHAVLSSRTGDANLDRAILQGLYRLRIARRDGDVSDGVLWAVVEVLWPIAAGGEPAAGGAGTSGAPGEGADASGPGETPPAGEVAP